MPFDISKYTKIAAFSNIENIKSLPKFKETIKKEQFLIFATESDAKTNESDIKIYVKMSGKNKKTKLDYLSNGMFRKRNIKKMLENEGMFSKKKNYEHFGKMNFFIIKKKEVLIDIPEQMKEILIKAFSIKAKTRGKKKKKRKRDEIFSKKQKEEDDKNEDEPPKKKRKIEKNEIAKKIIMDMKDKDKFFQEETKKLPFDSKIKLMDILMDNCMEENEEKTREQLTKMSEEDMKEELEKKK
jgi:hypothetical protein